ncbi:MAG: hypothetical protein MHPSP_000870, partial [Paramarteilia canceri]
CQKTMVKIQNLDSLKASEFENIPKYSRDIRVVRLLIKKISIDPDSPINFSTDRVYFLQFKFGNGKSLRYELERASNFKNIEVNTVFHIKYIHIYMNNNKFSFSLKTKSKPKGTETIDKQVFDLNILLERPQKGKYTMYGNSKRNLKGFGTIFIEELQNLSVSRAEMLLNTPHNSMIDRNSHDSEKSQQTTYSSDESTSTNSEFEIKDRLSTPDFSTREAMSKLQENVLKDIKTSSTLNVDLNISEDKLFFFLDSSICSQTAMEISSNLEDSYVCHSNGHTEISSVFKKLKTILTAYSNRWVSRLNINIETEDLERQNSNQSASLSLKNNDKEKTFETYHIIIVGSSEYFITVASNFLITFNEPLKNSEDVLKFHFIFDRKSKIADCFASNIDENLKRNFDDVYNLFFGNKELQTGNFKQNISSILSEKENYEFPIGQILLRSPEQDISKELNFITDVQITTSLDCSTPSLYSNSNMDLNQTNGLIEATTDVWVISPNNSNKGLDGMDDKADKKTIKHNITQIKIYLDTMKPSKKPCIGVVLNKKKPDKKNKAK